MINRKMNGYLENKKLRPKAVTPIPFNIRTISDNKLFIQFIYCFKYSFTAKLLEVEFYLPLLSWII